MLTDPDKYIISRLNQVITISDTHYENYQFGEVSRELYNYIWDEFASWYLEIAKVQLEDESLKENTQKILIYVLTAILKLIHPFIPFVTEELFLHITNEKTIMLSNWPVAGKINQKILINFISLQKQ